MNSRRRCGAMVLAAGLLMSANGQRGGRGALNGAMADDPPPTRPADAEMSRAKADREQNIKDATRLAELAEKVKADLAGSSSFTLSLATVKNAEEMAALAKKLHARLKTVSSRPDEAPAGFDAAKPRPPGKQ